MTLPTLSAPASAAPAVPQPIVDIHCGWGATATAPNWNDITAIGTAMKARGVGTAFVSSVLARRYDLPAGNEALAGAISEAPKNGETDVRGWYVIHPARASECIAQMRRMLYSPRFIGAALYTDPQTCDPVSVTDAHDLVTAFRRYQKPLLVETPNIEAMEEAIRIADDLQGVPVIASGMGGDDWREAVVLAARPANLYLDISGPLVPEKIEYALHMVHSRKMLFASGAPYTDPAAVVGLLDDVQMSARDRARILYQNANRMFNLGGDTGIERRPDTGSAPDGPANFLVGNVEGEGGETASPALASLGFLGGQTEENPE